MRDKGEECSPVSTRAVLYLRVSTGRQAEHDLSIPDQRGSCSPIAKGRAGRLFPNTLSLARQRLTIGVRNFSA